MFSNYKWINHILSILLIITIASCSGKTSKKNQDSKNELPNKFENEYFTINLPDGWTYDNSGWQGDDSIQNEVDFYATDKAEENACWIHCVKSYMHIQYKSSAEAAKMSKMMKSFDKQYLGIGDEQDSILIGGYFTYMVMYYYSNEDGDTIVDKQFITLLPKTHTVFYINSNFSIKDWEKGQKLGDKILRTFKFKDSADDIKVHPQSPYGDVIPPQE